MRMLDEPLGLPRGSVRGVIGILVALGLVLAPLYSGVPVDKWFEVLSYVALSMISFYFGTRANRTNARWR